MKWKIFLYGVVAVFISLVVGTLTGLLIESLWVGVIVSILCGFSGGYIIRGKYDSS